MGFALRERKAAETSDRETRVLKLTRSMEEAT
jgi:hypothetical protein